MTRTCLTCRQKFEGITADYCPGCRKVVKGLVWGPTLIKPRPIVWRDNVTGKYT